MSLLEIVNRNNTVVLLKMFANEICLKIRFLLNFSSCWNQYKIIFILKSKDVGSLKIYFIDNHLHAFCLKLNLVAMNCLKSEVFRQIVENSNLSFEKLYNPSIFCLENDCM